MSTRYGNSPYRGGFFETELPAVLAWFIHKSDRPESRPVPPSDFYRAPSWSWAASDTAISYGWARSDGRGGVGVQFATMISCSSKPVQPENPFGQLLHAELTLRGPLLPITWGDSVNYETTEDEMDPNIAFKETYHALHNRSSFLFDSTDDLKRSKTDTFFLPIFERKKRSIYGLILRSITRDQYKRHDYNTKTSPSSAETCYMRIGMVEMFTQTAAEYLDKTDRKIFQKVPEVKRVVEFLHKTEKHNITLL
ncbi:hypothetical protein GQ44DRAFT_344482 [Phaeosphaeriaceae sp. PMI808]|nr:hypothetical protein GQ44DRAFT_344482 [Phaeosphaeriaceae sp. PMI808]